METKKEEAIRKAWGVHYADDVDENGWRESNVGSLGWDKEYFHIMKKDENVYLIRPKMLNGIGTNNGWIRIESEDDLPQLDDDSEFWIANENGIFDFTSYSLQVQRNWKNKTLTHYQKIVKPKPPIY